MYVVSWITWHDHELHSATVDESIEYAWEYVMSKVTTIDEFVEEAIREHKWDSLRQEAFDCDAMVHVHKV